MNRMVSYVRWGCMHPAPTNNQPSTHTTKECMAILVVIILSFTACTHNKDSKHDREARETRARRLLTRELSRAILLSRTNTPFPQHQAARDASEDERKRGTKRNMRIVARAGPPHRPQERGNDHRDDAISDIGSSSSSHHHYPPRPSRVNPNSAHDNDSRHNNNKYDYGHNDKNDNDNDKDKQGQNINPKYNPRGNNDEEQKQKLRSRSSSNSNVVNQLAVAATKTTTAATTATATATKASAAAAAGANNNNNGIPFQTAGQTTAQRKQQHQHQQKKQHQHEPSALILQLQRQQQQQRHVATHENTTTRQDNTIINSRIMMGTKAIPSPNPNTASTFATTATAAPTTTTTATATTSRSSTNRNNNNTTVTTLTFPAPLLFTSVYGAISPPVTPHPLMVQYASKGRLIKLQQLYNDRHNSNNSNNNNNNNSNNNNNTNNNNSSNNNNNNKNVLNVRQQSKLFNECAIRAYKPSWEEVVEKRFSYVDLDADFDQVLDGGYNNVENGGGKTSNNNNNNNNYYNNNNNNYYNNNSNNEQKIIIMEKEEEIITKPTRLFYTDTPLIAASRNGHVHIVQWLLSSQVVDPTLESCPVGGDGGGAGGGSDDCGGVTTATTGNDGKDQQELKVHNAVNVANRMLDILTNSILDLMEAFVITAPLDAVDLERNRRWRKKKKSWPIFFQFVPPIGVNDSSSNNDNDDNKNNNKNNNKKKKNQNKNVSITNQLLQQFATQRSSQLLRALSSYHDILTMLSVALRAWSPVRYSSHVADGRYSGSRNIFSNVIQLERLKYLHHGEEDEIDDCDNGSNESDVNDEDDTQYVTFANTELGKAIREELKNAPPLEILDSISEKNLARAIYRYNKLMFPVVDDDRNCDDHDGGSSGRVDSKDEIQTNAILDNDFVPTAASCPNKPVPTTIPKSMLIPELGLKYKPIRNSQRSLCAGLPPNLNERHSERRESLHHSAPPNSAECQLDEVMPVSLNVSHGAHSAEPSSKRRDSLHSSAPPNSTDSQRWGASMTNAGTHHNISRLPQLPQSIPPPRNRFGIFSPSKSKGKGNGSHCDSKLASSIHTVYSSTNAPSVLSSISKREPNQNKFNKTLQKVANNDSSLTRLKLDGVSNLDESQWQRLYGALGKNTCIEKVTLRRCQITDDIAFSFAVCLMENATIKSVDLRDNLMTNESALGLLKVLEQSNANLMELKLDANKGVGDSTLETIQNILQGRSRSKRMFRLSQKSS